MGPRFFEMPGKEGTTIRKFTCAMRSIDSDTELIFYV